MDIKRVTIIVHDLVMTALAYALSIFLRWPIADCLLYTSGSTGSP